MKTKKIINRFIVEAYKFQLNAKSHCLFFVVVINILAAICKDYIYYLIYLFMLEITKFLTYY